MRADGEENVAVSGGWRSKIPPRVLVDPGVWYKIRECGGLVGPDPAEDAFIDGVGGSKAEEMILFIVPIFVKFDRTSFQGF